MKYMCNKSYSCEKALGGHLSSHKMVMDYVDDDVPDGGNYNSYDGGDDDAPDYYSLRKKVKGSGTALDDSSVTLHLHHVCKECNKGFRSLKALCGHMACHSDKERHRCEFQAGDKHRMLFVDATAECSETADSNQMQPRRRSKRVRFKNHAGTATKLGDGFSFISGVMPVEEVARCLMMMSNDRRDAGCWGRVIDYSDSPSVESEDKPPSSGWFSGSPRSSEEILYEPKQRYKNLDTFKRGYTKKIKRGIAMAAEEDGVAVTQEKKCNVKKRDNSRHECPICFRVFKSGQAMGGHKRSHFLQGGVEEAASSVVVMEKEVPMIDLNFPAFVEEGDDGGLFPWKYKAKKTDYVVEGILS